MKNATSQKKASCAFRCVAGDEGSGFGGICYDFVLEEDGGLTVSFNGAKILGGKGEDRIDTASHRDIRTEHGSRFVSVSIGGDGVHVTLSDQGWVDGDFYIKPDGTIEANRKFHGFSASPYGSMQRPLELKPGDGCGRIRFYDPAPV